jgi:hypothetical protein
MQLMGEIGALLFLHLEQILHEHAVFQQNALYSASAFILAEIPWIGK